jgi:hypothetical protein
MAKPMQTQGFQTSGLHPGMGIPQQPSVQQYGQPQTGGMTPYTPPQEPTQFNGGGQPQTGGDFTVNSPGKIGYQQAFDPFQQALGAMRGTGTQPYQPGGKVSVGPSQPGQFGGGGAFGGQGSGAPYDPRTPNYQPGAGNQTMLRQYAMQNGVPLNAYMGNQTPMWGNQQQSWEPSRPQTDSLSEMLRMYRGY